MAERSPFGISVAGLKARLKEHPEGAFAFFGPEELLKQFYLQKFVALIEKEGMADFNLCRLDMTRDHSLNDLLQEAEILPFGGERRLIVCRGLNPAKLTDGQAKELLALLQDFPPYLTLILYLEEGEFTADKATVGKKTVKALSEHLAFVSFPLQDERTLMAWSAKILARDGLKGETGAMTTLFRLSSGRMNVIRGELEKLSAYLTSQNRTTVTEEDVLLFAEDTTELAVWNLSDAVLDGNGEATAKILYNLKRHEAEPIVIAGSLAKSFTAAMLVLDGADAATLTKTTNTFPWQYERMKRSLHGKKRESAEGCLALCLRLDRALKGKRSNAWAITELKVLEMARLMGGGA